MDMYKILLVDDEPDNLALLYRTLRGKYEITKTTSPIEALKILDEQTKKYDFIFWQGESGPMTYI